MKQTIDINGYWTVRVYYNVCFNKAIFGFTKTYEDDRFSIIGIRCNLSKEELLNTLVHEAKHVQSHICDYYGVKEDSEEAAYLIGYLVMRMYSVAKYFL